MRPNPPKKKRALSFWPLLFMAMFCAWLFRQSVQTPLPLPAEPPRLYSNQCQRDLRLLYVDALRKARSSLFLVMFGLSDPAILSALSEKKAEEISLKVYYDPTSSPNVRQALAGGDVHPLREQGLMHQKILVVDDDLVFLGSANMTHSSLKMHDNLVIGCVSPSLARFVREHAPAKSGYLRTWIGGQETELWLLPDPRGHALQELKKHLRRAQRSIRIALFTLTHRGLTEELIQAHRRGVDVALVIDLHSGMSASAQAVRQLKQEGVRVLLSQGMQLMHHKFALLDGETLFAGSANWTKAAFYKNSDCLIALHHLTKDQKRFMRKLWRRIETGAKEPPH